MRRPLLACAALVLLFPLSNCGGEPRPIEPKATASRAPTAAPTSTMTPPALPKLAQRNDATGAANFVLYWVDAYNYAALTGDTELLREISDPDCEGCNRYIDLYERTYAAGGYFKGGGWRLKTPEVTESEGRVQVFGHLTAPAVSYRPDRNSEAKQGKPENSEMVFEARHDHGRWSLAQLVLQSEWSE